MQRDVEDGFGALFDFQFDRYVTIPIVRFVYKLAFALLCLNALVGLILTFTVVGDLLYAARDYKVLIQLVLVGMNVVFFLVSLGYVQALA